jgi:ribonuclease BN (tRNA processing enzyme)
MTSHLMLYKGADHVPDCSVGVIEQYARTGFPFHPSRSIFIPHHRADHNIEYGPLLVVGWINGMPLDVGALAPPPLKQMTEDFMRAYGRRSISGPRISR